MCVQKSIDWIYLYVSKKLWLELNFWLSRSEFLDDITREKRNLCLRASTQYPMIMDFRSLHRIMCTYGKKPKKIIVEMSKCAKIGPIGSIFSQKFSLFWKELNSVQALCAVVWPFHVPFEQPYHISDLFLKEFAFFGCMTGHVSMTKVHQWLIELFFKSSWQLRQ